MKTSYKTTGKIPEKLQLNIAVVGGGRNCKDFLEMLQTEAFPYVALNLVGVCDINPEAEGLQMAKKMGIYTTTDFRDFFAFENLDSIVELTNRREVLLELIKLRPEHVGVMEHNLSHFFRSAFMMQEWLKSMEHQVSLQKMSSDFLIQQSTAAIAVLNTDFTIAEANEAYLKIVGRAKEDVLGGYCYEIYYGLKAPCASSRPTLKCPMLETLKTGKSAHVVHEFPKSKDEPTYGHIETYPLKNETGEIFRIIEVWRDITEDISSRWEEKTRKLKADLNKMVQEDRMMSLGKLAASCVHEINNPIQGLLTFSDLMQEILAEGYPTEENLEKFRDFLSLMSKELERCGNIIAGLLSFSRETQLEYKSIDLNDVLDSVITLTRHKMGLHNIQLVTDLTPGMIMIRGDANLLQQALLNLIFNAIEAMEEGGQLTIVIKHNEADKQVQIQIQDTGHGIPEKNVGHIYDPFFTTKEEGKGTGLGLSIVHGVTKNHGGKIAVDSTVGKGTVFTLTFPTLEPPVQKSF